MAWDIPLETTLPIEGIMFLLFFYYTVHSIIFNPVFCRYYDIVILSVLYFLENMVIGIISRHSLPTARQITETKRLITNAENTERLLF